MKILHVNSVNYGGGLEQYLTLLFEALSKRGHENLYLFGQKAMKIEPLENSKCFHIPDITNFHCIDLPEKLDSVRQIIGRENPDLVYIHQVVNYLLIDLLVKAMPSIRFVHGFKLICPDGTNLLKTAGDACPYPLSYFCQLRAYKYKCMPRNIFKGLAIIKNCRNIANIHKAKSTMIVASEFMKSVLVQNGFLSGNIHVIPYFTHFPKRKKNVEINHEPMILGVGRLTAEKGMDHLLRAASSIPAEVRVVIVGDGPKLGSLKDLAKQIGISSRVSFTGWLSHEALYDYYQQASCVVVPSIWSEPFGIVGIEAMACEKPVAAYNVGGISQWLKDGVTGFLVPKGDENALAEKIFYFLKNPDQAKMMGQEGKQKVKQFFSPAVHLNSLLSLFENSNTNSMPS